MKKIQTIFDRDWEGNRGVIDKYIFPKLPEILRDAIATEKIDGMNIRITVRNHEAVRVEKRRNPSKQQKNKGIETPWYVDTSEDDSADKWIYDGVKNTDFSDIPDGEWSGELVGKNIQGNPLELDRNQVMFFTLKQAPIFDNVPITYNELKKWLPQQESKYGQGKIEGIVWHLPNGEMYKIKTKDFQK